MEATFSQIRDAISALPAKAFTSNGKARLPSLNKALKALDLNPVDVARRDKAMSGAEEPATDQTITILEASSNPVIVQLQGRRQYRMRVGVAYKVPEAVTHALSAAGVQFQTAEG